jgi:hypothetical protein
VLRLVERHLDAARQAHRDPRAEALLGRIPDELDALRPQLLDRVIEVVADQPELVVRVPVRRMNAELGQRQREDQPAGMRLDVVQPTTSRNVARSASASGLKRRMCAPVIVIRGS